MAVNTFREDVGANILVPAMPNYISRIEVVEFGASLTLTRGQAMGRKTSDGKLYPLNVAATDGTQTFEGFCQFSCATDSNGLVYLVFGGTAAGATFYTPPGSYNTVYTSGIFDPNNLYTSATGTAGAEVDTITPAGTITAADIYTIEVPASAQGPATTVQFIVVSGSTSATNVVTGLTASWNADATAAALATASGTATLILTSKFPGEPMNLTTYVDGVGTSTLVITTAAVSAQRSEIDTFTATNPTTGDVYTITITSPNLTTHSVSATVGATQTATAIDALLTAAWNADPVALAYATPSGTSTFILTATVPGNAMNLAGAVVGTGTIAKVVTKSALGRNIGDIQLSRPGAYVQGATDYWVIN